MRVTALLTSLAGLGLTCLQLGVVDAASLASAVLGPAGTGDARSLLRPGSHLPGLLTRYVLVAQLALYGVAALEQPQLDFSVLVPCVGLAALEPGAPSVLAAYSRLTLVLLPLDFASLWALRPPILAVYALILALKCCSLAGVLVLGRRRNADEEWRSYDDLELSA